MRPRVIPVLLLRDGGLVKTRRFASPIYVGDPINAVRIFNEKQVDELVILDISRPVEPNYKLIADICGEAFMPVAYGGGISKLDQIDRLLALGTEKVVINTAATSNPSLISKATSRIGSSSVVVSIDVRRGLLGRRTVYAEGGRRSTGKSPEIHAREVQELGAGEIILGSIDRDGEMSGYDLDLIEEVSHSVSLPVVALGGAGSLKDMQLASKRGASAAAAGSMFVFKGKHRAVLISYPPPEEIERILI